MLSKLAKIANRLDSIGLTKEADVLDAFIKKLAEDGTPAKPEGTAAPVYVPNTGSAVKVNLKPPAGYPSLTAPSAPLDPAAFAKAAYRLVMDKWVHTFSNELNRILKQDEEAKFSVNFSFNVNKNGSVDPGTIKVVAVPDIKTTSQAEGVTSTSLLSSDLKKEIMRWSFPPCTEVFEYEHPHAVVSGVHFGRVV